MTDKMKLLQRIYDATEALVRLKRGEVPSAEELAAAPLLETWYLTERHNFLALGGTVFGHPTLPDAAEVRTSCVIWLADDRRSARTVSRFYRLGTPLQDLLATEH